MKDLIVVIICLFFLVSCAGGNSQYQRNMGLNALGYGLGGAAVGAIGASVFNGDPAKGAFLGALTGALLGAGNTPAPAGQFNSYGYSSNYGGGIYERERVAEEERIRQQEYWQWEQNERARARNDARSWRR